jgi:hypothetical protein
MTSARLPLLALAVLLCYPAAALDRPGTTFKIFQFPPNMIPRIDGNTDDWAMVPDDYAIGIDQLVDDSGKFKAPDKTNLDVKVKVGWVKGLNRLYFLYEAYDNYWDFSHPDLHNDTFELVVDGDLSGGPLIPQFMPNKELDQMDARLSLQGVQAQNYHIMTPAVGKDWTMAWGCNSYVKEFPYANVAYNYNFKPGEAGKLIMELWITPFDYAGCEGPQRAVESVLTENKLIGLAWAVMDYDDVNSNAHTFWNLSRKHTMYGKADELVAFRLMPLEPQFQKAIDANWSFKVLDMNRRLVAFEDQSVGKITSWKWDFGDGTSSTEQHPIHAYQKAGQFVVVLNIEGPAGSSRRSKIWDVVVR